MHEEKDNLEQNLPILSEEFDKKYIKKKFHPKTSYGKKYLSKNYSRNNVSSNYNIYLDSKFEASKKYMIMISGKNKLYNSFVNQKRNISRNNPGNIYYYKENLFINQTRQDKKRGISNKNFFSKNNSSRGPKNKKVQNFTNFLGDRIKSLKNCINVNNPYMPFWINKYFINKNILKHAEQLQIKDQINNKNDLFYKSINRCRNNKNKNYFLQKKNHTLDSLDKIIRKDLIYNKSLLQKVKKIPKIKCSQSMSNLINTKLFNLYHQKKNKLQSIDDYNNNEHHENQDDEIIGEEKKFYQIQKNFFKTRKEIIEEPESLEEDN